MNILSLDLFYVRNYEKASFSFQPNCIHCLCGKNAQGKTNLIESIYFLSYLHSFRVSQASGMIQHGQEFLRIQSKIETNQRTEQLQIIVSPHKKHLFRYQDPVSKYSDFVGIVNAVLFCPDDMMIFQQSPKLRRRFIDMELIKLSKTYTSTLSHYQKLLKERNLALKQNRIDDFLIQIYTEQMIEDQKIILLQRSQFIQSLMEKARALYPFFTDVQEEIDARYETFVDLHEDNIEWALQNIYEQSYEKDKRYKQTTYGIHKDDIVFLLNGQEIDEVASQGQKRSFLLAVKLGLCQMIFEKTGQYPILLLDDVFSELDSFRKQNLIQNLPKNMQIFITTTDVIEPSWFRNRKFQLYEVNKGTIQEVQI